MKNIARATLAALAATIFTVRAEAAPLIISAAPELMDVVQDAQYGMASLGGIPTLTTMKIGYTISHRGNMLVSRSVPVYGVPVFGSSSYLTMFATDLQMSCNQVQLLTATPLKPIVHNTTIHHRMPWAPDSKTTNTISCP